MSRNWLIAALLLPLVVIGIGIGRAEHHLAHSTAWVFEIDGYDPRDLLRGRYIQFRVDLHEDTPLEVCDDNQSDRCCLCLTRNDDKALPRVQRATCERAKQCDGLMQTRYLSELRRYYIPEEDAWKLEQQFMDAARESQARLRVAIDDSGKPQIESLLINGQEIRRVPRCR